ncbi:MAG: GHKL domain-containing protein [Lachnospiraceae bacterium]|nr:GHKL domain-containing protein [Ruminococcus sp.]MCM1276258.1 GHKL domain-containing protein [Lachnospiraceae bacterium]
MIALTLYNITYLPSQALGVFALYKLMTAFFENARVKKSLETLLYVAYYLLTSSIYLIINIPLLNFAVNIIAIFSLTFLYTASNKKRILVGLLIYVFFICTEMIAVTLTGYINFPITEVNNYNSVFGAVSANVLIFIISMAANGFKSVKRGNILPNAYWGALFAVPVLSLYILVIIFQSEGHSVFGVFSSVAAILVMNFMVFFLFDRVSLLYTEKQENALIRQQNEYYANQLLLVENSHNTTSKLRHDIKNHLVTIDSYLEINNIDQARNHISEVLGIYQNKAEIVHTGFPAVDGLLNFKFRSAENLGIKVNIKADLPSDFNFSTFDLTVILGNLVDNALQAVSHVEQEKFIDLRMKCSKGMLIIKIANPYKNPIKREAGKIVTTKADKENHGFGLRNVNEVLERYNGTSSIDEGSDIFTVTVALYLE